MFKLQPNPTFWATVSIPVADDVNPAEIDINFKHKTRSEIKEFIAAARDTKNETDGDVEILNDIIEEWRGADVEYSRANLKTLLENYGAAARAITNKYISSLVHGAQKN